jgi:hypothetical protein
MVRAKTGKSSTIYANIDFFFHPSKTYIYPTIMSDSTPASCCHPSIRIALAFAAVSVASFSCWAFGDAWFSSETLLYTACAAVFLILGSLAVYPAVAGRISRLKFFFIFAAAFVAYAAMWCAFYLQLLDKRGEIFGSLFGAIAMVLVFRATLGRPKSIVTGAAVLFFWHTGGYFGGEWLADVLGGVAYTAPKLAWGLGYGLGFGAGLGASLSLRDDHAS